MRTPDLVKKKKIRLEGRGSIAQLVEYLSSVYKAQVESPALHRALVYRI